MKDSVIVYIQSKKNGEDQETIQSSTTPNPGYHMGKYQKYNKHTINITNKSQEVSPFPAGNHKAAMNRSESMRNTRHKKHTNDPHKKYRLGAVSKIFHIHIFKPNSKKISP